MKRWNIGDVMTRDVVSVTQDATYREIVQTLADHKVSAVPVIDEQRRVVGVVSEADLLRKVEFTGRPANRRSLFVRQNGSLAQSPPRIVPRI